MLKKISAILISLFFCNNSWATWAMKQHPNKLLPGGSTCGVTTTALGAGNLLVAVGAWGTSSQTLNSSPTNGCAVAWVHCPNCASTDAAGLSIDMYYCLNSNSGVTSITVNGSGTFDWCEVIEYSTTSGPPIFDIGGNRDHTPASGTTFPGVALSITGSNDVIVQGDECSNSIVAIGGSYTNPFDTPQNNGIAGWINANSGAAPTWTNSAGTTTDAQAGISFKETSAAATANAPFFGGD